ncbi:hypothetical protein AUJ65_03930 [Candidatus Micrarchaeota archaeon CG1_02_51_15]|nr:MAG: hypothetical protein AUJ65_03930 [Candidatus Micrarchaeota archaeon CG1_02_51_15]
MSSFTFSPSFIRVFLRLYGTMRVRYAEVGRRGRDLNSCGPFDPPDCSEPPFSFFALALAGALARKKK